MQVRDTLTMLTNKLQSQILSCGDFMAVVYEILGGF